MAPDPYNPQSRNKYSYCFNNPLKYTDPSGHDLSTEDGISIAEIDKFVQHPELYQEQIGTDSWYKLLEAAGSEEYLFVLEMRTLEDENGINIGEDLIESYLACDED